MGRDLHSADQNSRSLSLRQFAALAMMTAICMALVVVRVRISHGSRHLWLVWDFFLAWASIPLAWAFLRAAGTRYRWPMLLVTGSAWLFVFPNTPYLLTEVIHLSGDVAPGRPLSPAVRAALCVSGEPIAPPHWLDFTLLIGVAFSGIALTLTSLTIFRRGLQKRVSSHIADGICVASLLLAGIGVSIGRYQRFNSWDIVTRPITLASKVIQGFTDPRQPRLLVFGLAFGIMLVLLQVVAWETQSTQRPQQEA